MVKKRTNIEAASRLWYVCSSVLETALGGRKATAKATVGLFCYIFIFLILLTMEQHITSAPKAAKMGLVSKIWIGGLAFGVFATILGLHSHSVDKKNRANFVASLETPAFDATKVLGASLTEAETVLGPLSPEVSKATPLVADILGSKVIAGTTSTFWKKGDFIIWTTALNKKPIDQICIINPKNNYTTSEIAKKVLLADKAGDYSILGLEDQSGFCACIKNSKNPFCIAQVKTIAEKNTRQQKIEELCLKYKDWKESVCAAVVDKKVMIGMTPDQAMAAWGTPIDINSTIRSGGRQDQWVYGLGSYIYFTDGVLTSIQN